MLFRSDYYAILGVPRDARAEQVREAFHRFALRHHPDQHVDAAGGAARALRIFKRGAEGYRVLIDPLLRARYDAAVARGEVRLTPEAERRAMGERGRAYGRREFDRDTLLGALEGWFDDLTAGRRPSA